MSGMTGVVSWTSNSRAHLEPLVPDTGRYFRGTKSTVAVAGKGLVNVQAVEPFSRIAQDESRAAVMVGHLSSRTDDILAKATSLKEDPCTTLRDIGSQFAFFFADSVSERAYLAADAFASYALYYAFLDDVLYFSTDLESLGNHPRIDRTLCNQAIYDYLYFSVIPAPATIYKNIKRLPLGHILILDRNGVECRQWYRPTPIEDDRAVEQGKALRESLLDAVNSSWLDERSACFLSGGLDSSTVCGLASRVSDDPVAAYSIGFPENEYDEMPYARIAADRFGLDHRVHYVTPEEIHANMSTVLNAVGEPFSNASSISSFVCAKRAVDEGFDNLLAGDGGDELFAGNEVYSRLIKLSVFEKLPKALKTSLTALNEHVFRSLPGPLRKVSGYISQASLPFARQRQYYGFIEQMGPDAIFSEPFLNEVDPEHPVKLIQELFDSAPFDNFLQRMLYVDWRLTLADNDLRKVRVSCDVAGANVQFPMLDSRVVSVSESIPGSTMMPRGRLRGFYKNAFAEILPGKIITKQKHGFGVPVGRWMQSDPGFESFVDDNLNSLARREIIKPDFIAQARLDHKNIDAVHYGVVLWTLIVLETWFQNKNI